MKIILMLDNKEVSKTNKIFVPVLLVLFGSTISVILVGLNIAYAHSLPVTEIPAANSIVQKGAPLPSRVIIDFSERPDPNVSTIQVLNSKNERVDKGDFVIIGDHNRQAMTTLDTHKLTDGVYTVSWMTQSNDDGHVARGSYVVGIGNVGPGATPTASISSGVNGNINQRQPQVTAVTSNVDGIIKWPLIVSQAAIVGGIFSHFFLWEKFGSRIERKKNFDGLNSKNRDKGSSEYNKANLPWLKRLSIILVASSVAIIASTSTSVFLQVSELSSKNTISAYISVFKSILHGSSGTVWLVQVITAIVMIACSLSYYYLSKRQILAGDNITEGSTATKQEQQQQQDPLEKKQMKTAFRKTTGAADFIPISRSALLRCALVMGAISIFASSANSHNAGVSFLPSVAVFMDWLHFMAVSTWIGGLFYISAILLSAIKSRSQVTRRTTFGAKASNLVVYYLAILLPRFSLIATVSLGVIGISGLYMGWIQLHSLNNLFATPYGNILIIKLSAVLPLVLLGGYHQLKVHRSIVAVAKLGNSNIRTQIDEKSTETIQKFNSDNYNGYTNPSKNKDLAARIVKDTKDVSFKFSKTIKIESLLAISVLLIASLLTITSPPSKISSMATMSMSGSSPSSSSSTTMAGMSMPQAKNSTFVKQTTIMNVNTKIEINPFYSGFNTFKVSFTDVQSKPYTKVSAVALVFKNEQADIGPITANLNQASPGVYAVIGGYLSQPGQWDISMAAQRPGDYDLNYKLTSNVTAAPNSSPTSSATQTSSGSHMNMASSPASNPASQSSNNNSIPETPPPKLDSFALLAIGLAIIVGVFSGFSYKRSKQELKKTIQMLETE
jgi:putative copper export protein/methionine-rich copper-binding protein CopC